MPLIQWYMADELTPSSPARRSAPPRFLDMEYSSSLNARLGHRLIFTEDNMGWEWRSGDIQIPWH